MRYVYDTWKKFKTYNNVLVDLKPTKTISFYNIFVRKTK